MKCSIPELRPKSALYKFHGEGLRCESSAVYGIELCCADSSIAWKTKENASWTGLEHWFLISFTL